MGTALCQPCILRLGLILLVLSTCWPQGVQAAPLPPIRTPAVAVATIDGVAYLSVTARDVPLQGLLAEVAHQGGFTVTGRPSGERLTSVEILKAPLDRALRKLLSGENVIFLYDQPIEGRPAKLQRVILLGALASAGGQTRSDPTVDRGGGGTMTPVAGEPASVVPDEAETFDPDGPVEYLLLLTDHQDPRMRTAALEALTLHEDDERARRTLMDHIADPDTNIRLLVVGLLGPFIMPWPGAEEVVMGALRDPVSAVRHLALQTLWEASSPARANALQLALHDEDAVLRARAEELLPEVPNE